MIHPENLEIKKSCSFLTVDVQQEKIIWEKLLSQDLKFEQNSNSRVPPNFCFDLRFFQAQKS